MVNWSEHTKLTLPFNCCTTTQDKTKAHKARKSEGAQSVQLSRLLEIRANENIDKDEIITDQTIVDNDITSLYELNQRPNRLAADTSTLI